MTDPTNPGGWPDATQLAQSNDHWLLKHGAEKAFPAEYDPNDKGNATWGVGAYWLPRDEVERDYAYIGPCLTPAEIAAQVAAARAEEREACAALADENNGCLSPRCDCMDACAVDDVGKGIAAAIRARGTP